MQVPVQLGTPAAPISVQEWGGPRGRVVSSHQCTGVEWSAAPISAQGQGGPRGGVVPGAGWSAAPMSAQGWGGPRGWVVLAGSD